MGGAWVSATEQSKGLGNLLKTPPAICGSPSITRVSEALIGRYNAHNEQFAFINVGNRAERAAQNGTRHVRVDERGWLWLTHRGVICYNGHEWSHFSASLPDIDFSDTRLTYEDREGNIWIGLWGGGLIFCDPASIRRYTESDGLPDREIRCLGEDREGRMWIGTMGGMAYMEEGQMGPGGNS